MRSVKGLGSRVEGKTRDVALRSSSGPRPSSLDPQPRRSGLTLVELLITILIISILAGLILGVAALAGETAREAQSRHVVARLHNLLMEHYNTYTTRRVRVRPIDNSLTTPAKKGQTRALARLYALRELILMEVPDRWSDVLLAQVPSSPAGRVDARYPYYQDVTDTSQYGRTQLAGVYLRRYDGIANRINAVTGSKNTREDIVANESAECLYMVITLATGDGEARSLFGESSIGDTDGDGAPEFLDGWGHPINFLRWAPGFDSLVQVNANTLPLPADGNEWKAASLKDHDQFDVFRVDAPAFRLVPLIYSAGRDEELGIWTAGDYVVLQGLIDPNTSSLPPPANWPLIRPWWQATDPLDDTEAFLGTQSSIVDTNLDPTATDNVHNHLIGLR